MKQLLMLSAGLAFAANLSAQKKAPIEIHEPDGSVYRQCYWVKATKPLKELIAEANAKGLNKPKVHFGPADDGEAREAFSKKDTHHQPNNFNKEENWQTTQGILQAASTLENFEGQQGFGSYPQDPNGMIGSSYYVQTINSSFAAWDKTGAVYVPQTDLYTLFGSVGSCDCGDPVTVYDKIADRWIITEFENPNPNFTGVLDTLLFAVSQTNDPGGAYWIYAFQPSPGNFDDYPKYHVWGDGYYMTCNCQSPDMIVVYDRNSMLTGSPAGYIEKDWAYPNNCGGNFFCPMMLDCDGALPYFGSPEYLFYYWEKDWGCGGGQDSIIIQQITTNWNTNTVTINAKFQHLNVAAFNSNFPADFDANIPQPGNAQANYLASNDGHFAYRIPYLRWGTYNSAVMCFPVNPSGSLSNPVSAVEWFELHQDTVTKLWSVNQQATYGPNDGVSRWNPAIAEDYNGDIGLEYSVVSSTSTYAGLRYTGRRYCDALNTMTLAEGTAVSGNTLVNTPEGTGMRWGDYSHLSVDPMNGDTFWGTNMYAENGAGSGTNTGTRIFSFQVPACITGIANVNEPTTQLTVYQNGGTLDIKGIDVPEGQAVNVELFDAQGKKLMGKTMVATGTNLETSFNVSSLAKAIYIVRLGNDSFQRVVKVSLN